MQTTVGRRRYRLSVFLVSIRDFMPNLLMTSVAAIVVFYGLSVAGSQSQVASNNLIVGVLKETGIVIPFARYDGTRWTNSWPGPTEQDQPDPQPRTQVPTEWLGTTSLPTTWRLWLPGGTAHSVRIQGLTYSKSVCGHNWGLMTGFPTALNIRGNSCPEKTVGTALSTSQELRTFHQSTYFLSLPMLQKSFEELETREVSALNARIRGSQQANLSPWDLARRSEFPIHVEHVWQAELHSGETFYYVEAYRRYSKAAPTEGCPNISAFRGWISQDVSRAQSIISSRIVLTDCDFKEAGFTTPLGLLELRSGTFAVVENDGWESQAYGILKLERGAMTQVIDSPVR